MPAFVEFLRGEPLLSFLPSFYFENVTDITVEFLQECAIKAVLLDIDNTLSCHGAFEPFDGVQDWINKVEKAGIKLAVISNNKGKRVQKFAENVKINYYIANANKPLKSGFCLAKEALKVNLADILVVGDQIFTDVLGANLSGMRSALVEPKDKNEPISIKIKRVLEIPFKFGAKIKCQKKQRQDLLA